IYRQYGYPVDSGFEVVAMCEVNWVLLSGFIAAIASLANAALLVWMILVTRRYVNATLSILEVNRVALEDIRNREIRPYKNLVERTIRNLEELKARDLVYSFEKQDGTGWLSADDLLPADYNGIVMQATTFDAELYSSLYAVASLIEEPRKIVTEMQRVARSGRPTLTELPRLQADFRRALDPIISLLNSTRDSLLSRGQSLQR